MQAGYLELLDATIQHLERLRTDGERWIISDSGVFTRLSGPIEQRQRLNSGPVSPMPAMLVETIGRPPESPSVTPLPQTALSATPLAKPAALAALRERTLACQKCPHLVRARKNVVFGVGDIDSPLMFVGEAPGADEDLQGEPFVGAAGQLLTKIIQAMGYPRGTVYIANVLKCRPDTPGQSSGNRKPTPEEMNTCLPYLLEQIRIIQPRVIVALGATAVEGLFGKTVGITKLRGHWQIFDGTPVMPTYHPSYLLRNQARTVKREVWEDMLQVLEKLGASISEKQRHFFT